MRHHHCSVSIHRSSFFLHLPAYMQRSALWLKTAAVSKVAEHINLEKCRLAHMTKTMTKNTIKTKT